jgi:hypothetical protein
VTNLCKNHGERQDESLVDTCVDANSILQRIDQQIEQSARTLYLSNDGAVSGSGDGVVAAKEAAAAEDEVGVPAAVAGEVHVDIAHTEYRWLRDGDE